MKALENNSRKAVINGLALKLYRNTGIKHQHWTSIWPEIIAENARMAQRWADKWLDRGVPPKKAMMH